MVTSDNINELAKALVAAQLEIKHAKKDAKNPFFKSDYSTLESVSEACLPALNKHGIAVSQLTGVHEGVLSLKTMLMHTSGQWIAGSYPINPVKNDPQAMGSAMSYARRYTLAAIAGVVSGDDDAETAMSRNESESAAHKTQAPSHPVAKTTSRGPKPSDEQLRMLAEIARTNGWSNEDVKTYLKEKLGLESSREMSWMQYASLVEYIEKVPKKKVTQ